MFPSSTPSFTTPTSSETLQAGGHTNLHVTEEANIVALATKVGLGASTPTSTSVLVGNGTGTSSWSTVALGTQTSGVLPVNQGGSGASSSTGTGSNVLNNSPNIISPTESSGTYFNSTLNSPTINNPVISGYSNNSIPGSAIDNNSITTNQLANQSVIPSNLNLQPQSVNSSASNTVSGTSYANLATASVAVTITISANGIAIVGFAGILSTGTGDDVILAFALSGANTIASQDTQSAQLVGSAEATIFRAIMLTGLTPGATTFTLQARMTAGTGTVADPNLWVLPL